MRKKLYNGYKTKHQRVCRYCGAHYAERHEVFGGSNRQISIANHFQVDVCREHHRMLQDNIEDWAKRENLRLRQYFERKWLDERIEEGMTEAEAVGGWMHLIGKNYLDDIMPE